ncbi:MAG: cupredoxin domain-containing protein [Chloroflexi bacterium]|nr:cupredoxin domain-containing protein [Chloroflexota bacterium]
MGDRTRRIIRGLAGLGLMVAVGACSEEEEPARPATAAQGPAQEVQVAMGDFFYNPNEVVVEAGAVRFVLSNVGQTAHRFAISGQGVNVSTRNVGAGRQGALEVDLKPGTYKMGCTLGDHEKRGSVGTIAVK